MILMVERYFYLLDPFVGKLNAKAEPVIKTRTLPDDLSWQGIEFLEQEPSDQWLFLDLWAQKYF